MEINPNLVKAEALLKEKGFVFKGETKSSYYYRRRIENYTYLSVVVAINFSSKFVIPCMIGVVPDDLFGFSCELELEAARQALKATYTDLMEITLKLTESMSEAK